MILAKPEILRQIRDGRIKFEPYDEERITLPEDVCGWLNSRSRFARIGLMSHVAAPFLAPGISNRQILEIYNAGRNKIRLAPGMRICHVVLQECRGTATYTGAWKDQEL